MRVALVTHDVIRGNGQGRVNYEIARYLLHRGHSVTLVADGVDPSLLEFGAAWIPVHPVLRGTVLTKILDFAWRANRVLRQIRENVDLICANGFVCTHPHHVNIVHFVHSTWIRSPFHPSRLRTGPRAWYQYLYTRLNTYLERHVFGRAGRVVAVSSLVADELEAVGVPREKISTIDNGVDLDEFRPGLADRSTWGLPEHTPLALFAGDVQTSRKNLDGVLRALTQCPGWHLAVAGTVDGSPFPALARRLGIDDRVHFLGFRRDLARLMRTADAFVFPSRYEPFALVVLEALSSGVPVVTARSVGAAGTVPPEAGTVVDDPEDASAIAAALHSLAPPRPSARAAARRAAEGCSWTRMSEMYAVLFHDLQAPAADVPTP